MDFTERKPVIAPIDEVAEINLPPLDVKQADPKLRELLERGLHGTMSDLPLVLNDYVLGYINYFRPADAEAFKQVGVAQDAIAT